MKLSPHSCPLRQSGYDGWTCNRYIGNRIGTTDLMVKQEKSDPGSIRNSLAQAGLIATFACEFILKS